MITIFALSPSSDTASHPDQEMGSPVSLGGLEWRVTGTRRNAVTVRRSDDSGPSETKHLDLVLVDLTLTNHSGSGVDLKDDALSLVDGSGRVFEPNNEIAHGYLENAENLLWYETVPGQTRRGTAAFSVLPDSSCSALRIRDSDFLFPEETYVDLRSSDYSYT